MTRAAFESLPASADKQAPSFSRAVHETIKMGMYTNRENSSYNPASRTTITQTQ
jgi:hypothetical protein